MSSHASDDFFSKTFSSGSTRQALFIFGLFQDRKSAENAYHALVNRGYLIEDINLLMSDNTRASYFSSDGGDSNSLGNKALASTDADSAIGAMIAGTVASAGTNVLMPGLGLIAVGPFATALASVGGLTDGLFGALIGLGIPQEEAASYEQGIKEGCLLIGVNLRFDEDADYLRREFGANRSEKIVVQSRSFNDGDFNNFNDNSDLTIKVAEEELIVGKRENKRDNDPPPYPLPINSDPPIHSGGGGQITIERKNVEYQIDLKSSANNASAPDYHQINIYLSANEDDRAVKGTESSKLVGNLSQTVPAKTADSPRRYADFTFYREAFAGQKADRLEDGKPLKNNCWYQLETAIREKTTGIPVEGERLPVREPKQQSPIQLLVTAHSHDFKIENPVQFLVLPAHGDTASPAAFRVRPLKTTAAAHERAIIHLRMYYEFNLLEAVNVYAEVVNEFSPEVSKFQMAKPISFEHTRIEGELINLENVIPRQMHVDITKEEDSYIFTFAFCKNAASGDDKIVMTAPVQINQAEIESDLVELRKALLNLTTSETYIKNLAAQDEIEFARSVNQLANSGRNLWTNLFRREKGSAIWNIGEWLKKHPLALDAKIQISVENAASGFVFPWNLIYDGTISDDENKASDLNGFWGLRYEIEQRLPNKLASDAPIDRSHDFEVGLMLWNFAQANEQRLLIGDLLNRGKGRLARNGAITTAREAYQYLEDCNSQILYFFTHGHTKLLESSSHGGVGLKDFQALYQALPADSPLRKYWKQLYQDIETNEFEADRSWIELNIGKIYLDELYDRNINLTQLPIVILNMCESAQITPSLAQNSFIHFFLDRGASAVVGTECLMTPLFAHHFAKKLLETLFIGKSIGEAMLEARRDFIKLKNPLGLAYTLFGSTTQKIVPPPLQSLN